jgi:quinoprotein glucose dehydrogenase
MATATKPPYTTITAYDLNTGEIKWQVSNGDDPATLRAGGPHETGGVGTRNGMVVTKGGILFQMTKGNKVRAYDEDTGKVLWEGPVAGSSIGIPTMYESKGRQYLVVMSPAGGGAVAGAAGPSPAEPTGPRGYIAFALPANK